MSSDKPLKLLVTIPPNSADFDFQGAMVSHLERGLGVEKQENGTWKNDVGITMEVVKDA